MEKIRRVNLADEAWGQLSARITDGTWPVGTRIPSEKEIAETLGVSRTSVREAIRSLVGSGLLATRQGDGTYVVADDPSDAALRRHLEQSPADDVLEVRRGIDVVAARSAALRRTDSDLTTLETALGRRRDAITTADLSRFIKADIDFHLAVARASHNAVLSDLYQSFARALNGSIRGGGCLEQALREHDSFHEELLTAIRLEDPQAAVRAALNIIDATAPTSQAAVSVAAIPRT